LGAAPHTNNQAQQAPYGKARRRMTDEQLILDLRGIADEATNKYDYLTLHAAADRLEALTKVIPTRGDSSSCHETKNR
jgi:hypothetical protein